jgi:hypothetical protein
MVLPMRLASPGDKWCMISNSGCANSNTYSAVDPVRTQKRSRIGCCHFGRPRLETVQLHVAVSVFGWCCWVGRGSPKRCRRQDLPPPRIGVQNPQWPNISCHDCPFLWNLVLFYNSFLNPLYFLRCTLQSTSIPPSPTFAPFYIPSW